MHEREPHRGRQQDHMRIALDALQLQKQTSSIGVFQLNLIKHMADTLDSKQLRIFTTLEGAKFILGIRDVEVTILKMGNVLTRLREISKLVRLNPPEAYIATFNLAPRLPPRTKLIVVSHDFSHGRYDISWRTLMQGTAYRVLHRFALRNADIVLANSSFTAAQAVQRVGKGVEVRVIPHDCDPEFKEPGFTPIPPSFWEAMNIKPGRYVFYAGRVRPKYKAIGVLLKAMALLPQRGLQLVVVANDQFNSVDARFIQANKIAIRELHDIPREDLIHLYDGAQVFVYPSAYEGFGLPILEAQNRGCPLITRNAPPMNETAGRGTLFFDGSPEDLAGRIQEVSGDPSVSVRLALLGQENAKSFNWALTASMTLDAIRSVVD